MITYQYLFFQPTCFSFSGGVGLSLPYCCGGQEDGSWLARGHAGSSARGWGHTAVATATAHPHSPGHDANREDHQVRPSQEDGTGGSDCTASRLDCSVQPLTRGGEGGRNSSLVVCWAHCPA